MYATSLSRSTQKKATIMCMVNPARYARLIMLEATLTQMAKHVPAWISMMETTTPATASTPKQASETTKESEIDAFKRMTSVLLTRMAQNVALGG